MKPFFPANVRPEKEFETREESAIKPAGVGSGVFNPASLVGGKSPIGASSDARVISVFSGRPVNAQDFLQIGGTLTVDGIGTTETASFSYTVPQGRVAVVGGIAFSLDLIYPAVTIVSMVTQIFVDNNPVLFMDPWNNAQILNRTPTFFLVDENKTITIRSIRVSTLSVAARIAATGVTYTPNFTAEISGTMLSKRGLPVNFEIGSK